MSIKINTHGYGQFAGMSRRKFLKGTAMGAAGIAAAGALGGGLPALAQDKDPLVFSFWPWGSEIVTSNADLFMAEPRRIRRSPADPRRLPRGAGDQARLGRRPRHVLRPARPSVALARRRLDQAGRRHAGPRADSQRDDPRPRSGHRGLQRRLSRAHLLQWRALLYLPQSQAARGLGVRGVRQSERLSPDLGRGGEDFPRAEGQGDQRCTDPAGLVQRLVGHALGADRAVLLRGRDLHRRGSARHLQQRHADPQGPHRLEAVVGRGSGSQGHPDDPGVHHVWTCGSPAIMPSTATWTTCTSSTATAPTSTSPIGI